MRYIFIILVIGLSSCQTHKQWTRKGIINKWLDTTKVKEDSSKSLDKDTNRIKAIVDSTNEGVDNVIDSTYEANKEKPCPEIRDTITKEVIKYLNRTLKPKLNDLPVYKNDSLTIDKENYSLKILYKNGKLGYKLTYKQCTINTPFIWYKDYWWIWLIIGFISGIIITYFIRKVK